MGSPQLTPTEFASAVTAITLGFSVLPAALTLLSLVWLSRYSLTAADVAATHPDPTEVP